MLGDCATIINPTVAKLEYRTSFKWLVINEIVDITPAEWRNIQQFLLDAGAFKPSIEKHSRSYGGSKETLDISKLSVSLFFNDIDNYPNPLEYFDFVSKDAIKNRFPALRFYGTMNEDFNSIKYINIEKEVKNNMDFYKNIIYTLMYYKQEENILSEVKRFKLKGIEHLPERWIISIGRMLTLIDLYCESQEELNEWVAIVLDSINEYKKMLTYAKTFVTFKKRYPEGTETHTKAMTKMKLLKTWSEKIELLQGSFNLSEGKKLW